MRVYILKENSPKDVKMKKFLSIVPVIAISAVLFAAIFGCKGVADDSGIDPTLPTLTFYAEVREAAPSILRLTVYSSESSTLELTGNSMYTLSSGGEFPAHLTKVESTNGIVGIGFADDSPNTALFLLEGYVSADDLDLTLEYDGSDKKEIFVNGIGCNSFSVKVVNLVKSILSGPTEPDPTAAAPVVTRMSVSNDSPQSVLVGFNKAVIIKSLEGLAVTLNGEVQPEITAFTVTKSGIVLTLKYGIAYGDYAALIYTKPDTDMIVSTQLKSLATFSAISINNDVDEGTDPNNSGGSALTGLQVLLPRTSWNVGEDLLSSLTVLADYADAHSEAITAYEISPQDPTAFQGNNQKITVSYQGRIGSISINVKAAGTPAPTFAGLNVSVARKNWAVGEQFLPTVIAVYSDSSYGTILSGYETTPAQPTAAEMDDLAVIVSYTVDGIKKSSRVAISVKPENELPTVKSLAASVEKQTWIHNEAFRINVQATYTDGSKGNITYGYIQNPTSPTLKEGTQPVTVSYGGQTSAPLLIDVVSAQEAAASPLLITNIAAAANTAKPTWILNEILTLTVTATYNNNTSGIISKGYYLENLEYPTSEASDYVAVKVVYMDLSDEFSIRVVESADWLEPLTSITARSLKNDYDFKEPPQIVVEAFYGTSGTAYPVIDNWECIPADITGTYTGLVTVEIIYTDGTQIRNTTFNVNVKPLVIGSGGIAGDPSVCNLFDFVNAPQPLASPDIEGGGNPYYTVSDITWNKGGVAQSSAFDYETVYSAVLKINPKTGYTLNGVPEGRFTHSAVPAGGVSLNAASKTVTITFPATAAHE
jgi:hypothetical protein